MTKKAPKEPVVPIVDRFEGDWAVIEYGRRRFNFPRELLPPGAKEGDVLRFSVSVDPEATDRRQREIQKLMDLVFEDDS
ncbi:MAG: DUF3006 domain-containing protein [Clostridia bacterium]|nr:DUF3006 domain-containing protein [Clostridia bacterium]